ncbi:hypothetical protein [Thermasporomyces composti]|uniref:hypothetical protein n=1 Tax=Thermasporomyces composti TaxID=696763 RepID=UPI000E257F1B|nr:hypothetical protein [Thermasporomyces composti]
MTPTTSRDGGRAVTAPGTRTPVVLKLGPGDPEPTGHADYDEVIATVPVREIPYSWVRLVRPGGTLHVSWLNPFSGPATARLTVVPEGRASGHFVEMADHPPAEEVPSVVRQAELSVPWYRTTTSLDPEVIWSDPAALFALGIRLPRLRCAQTSVGRGQVRRWVHDTTSAACAVVTPSGAITVEQHGPQLLWREVEAAYQWWEEQGRPEFHRFGLSVTSFGQFAWLDDRCSGRIWRV